MTLYQPIITSLLPIFLIIALGSLLRTANFLPAEFFPNLNRLAFFIGLPILLFSRIATSTVTGGPAMRVFWVIAVVMAVVAALAFPLARKLKLDGPGRGAFIQAALRGNLTYIGLSVIIYSLAADVGTSGREMETIAILALVPTVPMNNIIAVILLIHSSNSSAERPGLFFLIKKILANPLLIACLLGILTALSGWQLPTLMTRTLTPLGQIALPLALLSIGASLAQKGIGRKLPPALACSLLKVGLTPLLGYFIGRTFGLSPVEMKVALIFLACPTAVSGYVMAQQLGADEELAGNAVVISTMLSFFSLAAVMIATAINPS